MSSSALALVDSRIRCRVSRVLLSRSHRLVYLLHVIDMDSSRLALLLFLFL